MTQTMYAHVNKRIIKTMVSLNFYRIPNILFLFEDQYVCEILNMEMKTMARKSIK
jgi:hypothetical protein